MSISDTSAEADAIQLEIYRRMSPKRKIEIVGDANRTARRAVTPSNPDGLAVALLVVEILDRLGIEHHLGGSYASSIHGTPRQTQDVDLVVDLRLDKVQALVDALGEDFYAEPISARRAVNGKSGFSVVHLRTGVKVDLFCRGDAPFDNSEFEGGSPSTPRQTAFVALRPSARFSSCLTSFRTPRVSHRRHFLRRAGFAASRTHDGAPSPLQQCEGKTTLLRLRRSTSPRLATAPDRERF